MDHHQVSRIGFGWLVAVIMALSGACHKPVESKLAFEVKLNDRSDAWAVISWTKLDKDASNGLTYTLSLNGDKIAGQLTDTTFRLEGLRGSSTYDVLVTAEQSTQVLAQGSLKFSTFVNYPPNPFSIFTDTVSSSSVSMHWLAIDPENRHLHYAVYLNGQLIMDHYDSSDLKLTGLSPDIYYLIRVEAIDEQGNHTTAVESVRTLAKEGALLLQKTMKHDGVSRTYALYLPSYLSSSMPLVMFFHGAGGHAWPQMQSSPFKAIAEQEHFMVVFPQATIWDQPDIPSWNVVHYVDVDDVGFVESMLQQLEDEYPVNDQRVYACGMSSGGFMTYALAFSMGEKLAAIAPVAGFPIQYAMINTPLKAPLPLLHIHGTHDSTVTYLPSVPTTIDYFVENNVCNSTPVLSQIPNTHPEDGSTITVYTYESPYHRKDVVLYKIEGGGHSWPGSASDPSANKDIVVEWEIWKFFRDYEAL